MKRRSAQLGMLILIPVIIFPGFGCQSGGDLATRQASGPQEKIEASKLFNQNCSKCHGQDGRAKTFRGKLVGARNFTDTKWQASITDKQISAAIKEGPEEMPAFKKKLSQEEIDALVVYVRSFKQEQRDGTTK